METERRICINNDLDIVMARMQARQMAKLIGFGTADQARISLAASELARLLIDNATPPIEILMSTASKNGQQGMQVACLMSFLEKKPSEEIQPDPAKRNNQFLVSTRQLMDESILEEQSSGHTRVTLIKWLN